MIILMFLMAILWDEILKYLKFEILGIFCMPVNSINNLQNIEIILYKKED